MTDPLSNVKSKLIIGTRGSELALWQARHVASLLGALGIEAELKIIQTTGDLDQRTAFGAMGGKGIFVKEIEAALLDRSIDLAIHSLKDLPTELPEGLHFAAALDREPPFDALISRDGLKLAELPQGAKLATGSLRRAAQALAIRPDLQVAPLRGNVPTRIRKIREGEADATMLAISGLKRLGLAAEATQIFSAAEITPAMGQGALALECRVGDLDDLMAKLNHTPTWTAVQAERIFLAAIGGGCKTPAGVLAEQESPDTVNTAWRLCGLLASPDGTSLLRETRTAIPTDTLNQSAADLAREMISRADEKIRAVIRG